MAQIKKIKIGATQYEIKDAKTVDTVNGYSFDKINDGTETFANKAITTAEIDSLLATVQGGNK
jgi:hypothetical protein